MDEKYLELLADYAARQISAQREKIENAPKVEHAERAARARQAKRVGTLLRSEKRSAAVHDAYRHALLLALGGRTAAQLGADEGN